MCLPLLLLFIIILIITTIISTITIVIIIAVVMIIVFGNRYYNYGNKATQLFCVIPAIAPCIIFYFLFYIAVQFLIVNSFE